MKNQGINSLKEDENEVKLAESVPETRLIPAKLGMAKIMSSIMTIVPSKRTAGLCSSWNPDSSNTYFGLNINPNVANSQKNKSIPI